MSSSIVQSHGALAWPLGVALLRAVAFNPNIRTFDCLLAIMCWWQFQEIIAAHPIHLRISLDVQSTVHLRHRIAIDRDSGATRDADLLARQQRTTKYVPSLPLFLGGGSVSWKTRTLEWLMPRWDFNNSSWSSLSTYFVVLWVMITLSVRFLSHVFAFKPKVGALLMGVETFAFQFLLIDAPRVRMTSWPRISQTSLRASRSARSHFEWLFRLTRNIAEVLPPLMHLYIISYVDP